MLEAPFHVTEVTVMLQPTVTPRRLVNPAPGSNQPAAAGPESAT